MIESILVGSIMAQQFSKKGIRQNVKLQVPLWQIDHNVPSACFKHDKTKLLSSYNDNLKCHGASQALITTCTEKEKERGGEGQKKIV